MALGNVVGSNILNVLLIRGLSATIAPLFVSTQPVRTDVPVMIGASLLVLQRGFDGTISRLNGLLLVAGTIGYALFLSRNSRKQATTDHAVKAPAAPVSSGPPLRQLLQSGLRKGGLILGGIVLLVLGSSWLVSGATALARILGLSELVIGLTVITAGTGLPEIATSALASWRGQPDIAVGNVVGSNILNILLVLGLTSVVAPLSGVLYCLCCLPRHELGPAWGTSYVQYDYADPCDPAYRHYARRDDVAGCAAASRTTTCLEGKNWANRNLYPLERDFGWNELRKQLTRTAGTVTLSFSSFRRVFIAVLFLNLLLHLCSPRRA